MQAVGAMKLGCLTLAAGLALVTVATVAPCRGMATPPAKTAAASALTSPRKLASVTITGSPFPDADVLASAGLQLGADVTEDDFRHATGLLGLTGAFREVRYKYDFTADTVNLQIDLRPAEHYVDVQFDNFVWMPDQELRQALKKRVPLFDGKSPVEGEMLDQLALAIDWVLNDRGIGGHAEYERTAKLGDTSGQPGPVVFSVKQITIRVSQLDFPGVSAEMEPLLQKASEVWSKENYSNALTQDLRQFTLPLTFARRGFLNAKIAEPALKITQPVSSPVPAAPTDPAAPAAITATTAVEVSIPVMEGRRYKLGQITWQGNKALGETKLASYLTIGADSILDEPQLHAELDRAQASYGRIGYMRASLTTVRTLDDAKGTANYLISVDEGPVYRMGTLAVEGIDHKEEARVQELWPLREGDVFSTVALQRLPSPAAIGLAANYEWAVTSGMGLDDVNHTVDVTLHFEPKAKQR